MSEDFCQLEELGALSCPTCYKDDCNRCGWSAYEHQRRVRRIYAGAMKKREGLRYLPIYRKRKQEKGGSHEQ